ncbi:MAG: substrate-binding domain-containing protein, partial [Nocardioidaceae bacterium]|nr:substrate-binding domain-containing protein [Nocardioidaceae bacterium]
MKIRRFSVVAASLALALGVSACGSDSGSGSGSGDQKYVAIVSKGFQHQFWQAVKKGAEEQAEKENVRITFEGPPTEQDIEVQVNMLSNALAKNP